MLPFPHGFRLIVWWNAPESETRFTKVVDSWRETVLMFPENEAILCHDDTKIAFRPRSCWSGARKLVHFCRRMDRVSGQVAPTYKAAMYKDAGLVISCL